MHCTGDCTCEQAGLSTTEGEGGSTTTELGHNYFPTFGEWLDSIMNFKEDFDLDDDHGDMKPQEGHAGEGGDQLRGVGASDGEGGGAGRVKQLVDRIESENKSKVSRVKTPRMGRGIRKDGHVQMRISSLTKLA